jgi:3-(3-hydroxy-phenyl)propionate hydroxylase
VSSAQPPVRPPVQPQDQPVVERRSRSYDVAIIGYGPVGVTAANLLGARGLSVLVAERDGSVYARARAIATDEEIIRIWQRVGLAERLKQDMLWDKAIDFVDAEGESFLKFAPQPRGNGHPTQLFIYQPALEQVLREGAERFSTVEVRLRTEVVRQTQDDHGVELTLMDLDTNTVSRERATYVIAADGGSSPTRGRLGIGFEGRTYEDRWVVIDTKVLREWPEVDRLRFHCNPARPAVDCPTPLGHHRWEFPVLPGDDEEELVTETAVRRLLVDQGVDPDNIEVLRAVIYSHHVRFAAKWRAGRIFLAGDAAHVMPPWIGQGMASGVRDVNNLCWKLAGVINGELPESVLDSYAPERMPHVRSMTAAAVFFGRVITERRRPVTAVRDPLFRVAMKAPFVGAFLRDGSWFPETRYTKGLLAVAASKASSRRAGKLVGQMVPQPWVQAADGSRIRLDDALGGSWAVLHAADERSAPDPAWSQAGVRSLTVLPAGSSAADDSIVDVDDVLVRWMRRRGVTTLAVRPDAIVYAAAASGALLAAPPLLKTPSPGPSLQAAS